MPQSEIDDVTVGTFCVISPSFIPPGPRWLCCGASEEAIPGG